MKKLVHKLEIFVDRTIPFLLFLLLLIIIGEIFFHEFMVRNNNIVQVIDWVIIAFFAVDLVFKYMRIRDLPKFLRVSWIEIIAIFPFFLVFRLFDSLAGLFGAGEAISETQRIVHLGAEAEREIGPIAKEVSRTEKFARFIRPLARSIRFLKLENPKVRKETKKELERTEKEAKKVFLDLEKIPRHIKAAFFYEKAGVSYKHNKKTKEPGD